MRCSFTCLIFLLLLSSFHIHCRILGKYAKVTSYGIYADVDDSQTDVDADWPLISLNNGVDLLLLNRAAASANGDRTENTFLAMSLTGVHLSNTTGNSTILSTANTTSTNYTGPPFHSSAGGGDLVAEKVVFHAMVVAIVIYIAVFSYTFLL